MLDRGYGALLNISDVRMKKSAETEKLLIINSVAFLLLITVATPTRNISIAHQLSSTRDILIPSHPISTPPHFMVHYKKLSYVLIYKWTL